MLGSTHSFLKKQSNTYQSSPIPFFPKNSTIHSLHIFLTIARGNARPPASVYNILVYYASFRPLFPLVNMLLDRHSLSICFENMYPFLAWLSWQHLFRHTRCCLAPVRPCCSRTCGRAAATCLRALLQPATGRLGIWEQIATSHVGNPKPPSPLVS
jgi:hypothetical protein